MREPLNRITSSSICAEIGVWKGDFSQEILEAGAKELHLIDPWESALGKYENRLYSISQKDMDVIFDGVCKRFIDNPRVHIHRLSSAAASSIFQRELFDWVYVDGNHSYEYVFSDLCFYWSKIRPGGWLTGDDAYQNSSILKAVNDFVRVIQLTTLILLNKGQFIIQKGA